MSFLRQSAGTFVFQVAAAAAQLAAGVLLARVLLTEGRGLYGLLVLIPSTALLVAALDYGTGALREVTRRRSSDGAALGNALLLAAVAGGGMSALLFLARGPIAAYLGPEAERWAVGLALASVPLLVLDQYLGHLLVAMGRVVTSQGVKLVQAAGLLALLPTLFALRGRTVTSAVEAWALSLVLADVLGLILALHALETPLRLDRGRLGEAVRFGLRVVPATIGMYLLFRVDLYLVRAFRSLGEVGVYALATSLAVLFQLFARSIERVVTPRIMGRSPEEAARYTPRVTRGFVMVMMPLAVVTGLLAFPLVPLVFGEPFRDSAPVFALFLPGLVIANVGILVNCDLLARGRPAVASATGVACLVLNVALNLWWIPRYGVLGAATASLLCYSLFGVVLTLAYRAIAGVPLVSLWWPRPGDVGEIRALLASRGPASGASTDVPPDVTD